MQTLGCGLAAGFGAIILMKHVGSHTYHTVGFENENWSAVKKKDRVLDIPRGFGSSPSFHRFVRLNTTNHKAIK